jgi:rhodanese-related sulfurtransferase
MEYLSNYWWLILITISIVILISRSFKNLKKTNNIKEFIDNNAVIIDVRSESEFNSGNLEGSVNVPLKDLMYRVNEFKKDKKYITVCTVGMRAESAKKFFEKKGYQVVNGGRWSALKDLRNNT